MSDNDLLALKDRAADRFWRIERVDAVGIGGRDVNGVPTGEKVLKIFLNHATADDQTLFPATFEGLPVDLVSAAPVGRVGTVAGAVSPRGMLANLTQHLTIQGGVSIATEGRIGLGTLGCVLRDKNDGSAFYGLTNYHIVSIDGKLSRSRRVSHPAVRNAETAEFEFDDLGPLGLVAEGSLDAFGDAAVFRLSKGVSWIPFVQEIGYVKGSRDVTVDDVVSGTFEVRKTGCKTATTGGTIHAIADLRFEGIRQKNVLLILPNQPGSSGLAFFGFSGDSGAVVLNAANEVIGLFYGVDAGSPAVTPISGFGFAVRIGTVLDFFRGAAGLDLEVAAARNPAATDADDPAERQTVPFPAGVPAVTNAAQLRTRDRGYYRPLIGGSEILAERVGSANAGCLGCIVTNKNDENQAFVLTSFSALSLDGVIPPTTDTEVGQPDVDKSLSRCCDKFVGTFAKAGPTAAAPTAAIVRVKQDEKWLPEVMRIGVLTGSKTIEHADIDPNDPLTVFKSGPASRLTSGTVVRVADSPVREGVAADAMLIRPHDDPSRPTDEVHFSRVGDRGAAVVNIANEVIGVLYGEVALDDSNGRRVGHGLVAPIAAVLAGLAPDNSVELQVARAERVGAVQTVSARSALKDDEVVSRLAAAPVVVPDQIRSSPVGRDLLQVWQRHERELRHLIDRNRRVATAWRRNEGPALLQALARTVHVPAATIPTSVNGLPIAVCLERLGAAFCQYGSADLVSEITRLRSNLPSIAGLTLSEILATFARTDLTPHPA